MLRKTLNELLRISKMKSFGHVNFLWLIVSSIQYAGARNVALGKSAYQTDTFTTRQGVAATADRAIDGNTSGNMDVDKSCTHTQSSDATWSVDLGAIYQVSTVTIYNRNEYSYRLQNVEVFIGLDKDGPYSLAGFHEGVVGASYTFTMPPNSKARFVNITRNPPYEYLTLCEVEVESTSSKFATNPMAKIQNSTPLATISNVRSPIGCAYACHMDLKCLSTNFNAATLTCDLFETPLEIGDASPASSEYTAMSCVP